MNIAIIAQDTKKELMVQFCIAYCGILGKHKLCSTSRTGKLVSDATGLSISRFLSGSHGGCEQIASRIACNEIDLLLFFRDPMNQNPDADYTTLLRLCDVYNVPLATNIASAEVMVTALDAGSLDWRELVNPRSDYNMKNRKF